MKILYQQVPAADGFLNRLGIENCYFKYLVTENDSKIISRKPHYHTDHEVHLVEAGNLLYETEEERVCLNTGHFLLIPSGVRHRVVDRSPGAVTFSITFRTTAAATSPEAIIGCLQGSFSGRLRNTARELLAEHSKPQPLGMLLTELRVAEILTLLLRGCGLCETEAPVIELQEDPRLTMAKQYIADNIDDAPTVVEVAAYCHLGTRQLGRLFLQAEKMAPAAYIHRCRAQRIQTLLHDRTLTLGAISEKLHFSSEYYFSTFFKKHSGMSPKAYRIMYGSK